MDYRPRGFRALTPGLSVEGSGRMLDFLVRVFDGAIVECLRNADQSVAHGAVRIGDSMIELSEARPQWPARPCAIHHYGADPDALYARALAEGATSLSEPADASYGDRAAAVRDVAGNHWYLARRLEGGPIPSGFHTLTPYVLAAGADSVIALMRGAFGAVEQTRVLREDGTIMHAELRIDDSPIEIAEAAAPWLPMPCALHLYVPDADSTHRRAIAEGARALYEPMDMPYGDREGGLQDAAGNHWYVATHREDVPLEEVERRMAAMKM